ncbi:hypothetical protein HDV05_000772 [Chytridiales sp. JEL 0842]|nr:hypothetical protein HDV05_000772 [Chytridiales sp. JEL 0842]
MSALSPLEKDTEVIIISDDDDVISTSQQLRKEATEKWLSNTGKRRNCGSGSVEPVKKSKVDDPGHVAKSIEIGERETVATGTTEPMPITRLQKPSTITTSKQSSSASSEPAELVDMISSRNSKPAKLFTSRANNNNSVANSHKIQKTASGPNYKPQSKITPELSKRPNELGKRKESTSLQDISDSDRAKLRKLVVENTKASVVIFEKIPPESITASLRLLNAEGPKPIVAATPIAPPGSSKLTVSSKPKALPESSTTSSNSVNLERPKQTVVSMPILLPETSSTKRILSKPPVVAKKIAPTFPSTSAPKTIQNEPPTAPPPMLSEKLRGITLVRLLKDLPHPFLNPNTVIEQDAPLLYNFLYIKNLPVNTSFHSASWGAGVRKGDGVWQSIWLASSGNGYQRPGYLWRTGARLYRPSSALNFKSILKIHERDSENIQPLSKISELDDRQYIHSKQTIVSNSFGSSAKHLLWEYGDETKQIDYPVVSLKYPSSKQVTASDMHLHQSLFASGSTSGDVFVWDTSMVKQGEDTLAKLPPKNRMFDLFETAITSISFHPQSPELAIASADRVLFKDVRTGKDSAAQLTNAHTSEIRKIHWNPADANFLLTGDMEGSVKVWDVRKLVGTTKIIPQSVSSFEHSSEVTQLRWSPHHRDLFLNATVDGFVNIYNSKVCF